ncbi:unnamed protein product [Closterium sp. NIES-64]|nr:unnamed protein product [Closterium sp. NIES-64]
MSDCAAAWGRNDLPSSPCYSELTKCDPVSRNTISLNFSSMVLTGVIPPSIGLLTVLTYLYVSSVPLHHTHPAPLTPRPSSFSSVPGWERSVRL